MDTAFPEKSEMKGTEFRFHQGRVDGGVADRPAKAGDFSLSEDNLLYNEKVVSPRALNDFSRMLGIPRHLFRESSQDTLRRVVRERLRVREIEKISFSEVDDSIVLALLPNRDYHSPLAAVAPDSDVTVHADFLRSDKVRVFTKFYEKEIGGQKFTAGCNSVLHTTTSPYCFTQARIEKEVCTNGMMMSVADGDLRRIELAQDPAVLKVFFERHSELAADFAALFEAAHSVMADIPITDIDDAVSALVNRRAISPRVAKKLHAEALKFADPAYDLSLTGINGHMETIDDLVQAAAFVAQRYSVGPRQRAESTLGRFVINEFLYTDNSQRHPLWRTA